MVDSAKNYVGLYAKAVAGAVVAGLGAYAVAIQDGSGITGSEWLGLIGTVLVALLAVFAVPNVPEGVRVYGKAIVGAVIAAVGVLGTSWLDGSLTQVEVISAIVAFIAALGLVGVTPNAAASDPTVGGKVVPVTAGEKYILYSDRSVEANVDPEPQVVLGH